MHANRIGKPVENGSVQGNTFPADNSNPSTIFWGLVEFVDCGRNRFLNP